MSETGDLRIRRSRPLVAPRNPEEGIPLTAVAAEGIGEGRRQIGDIVHRRDPRLLVIVGPCSIHAPAAAKEYAERLIPVAKSVSNRALLVMRVYFENHAPP